MINGAILSIAGIVGALFIGLTILISRSREKNKKNALKNLIQERGASHQEMHQDTDQTESKTDISGSKNKKDIAHKLKTAGSLETDNLQLNSIRYLLIQAGLETPLYRYWIWSCASCIFCFLIAHTFGLSQIAITFLTFTGFFGLPRYILKRKVRRRQNKFLEELADCLEGMIRLLKSGMPISEAIAMTSREFTGPIGEEMTKVYEAQRIGDTLPEAVQKMAFRVPLPEVKMFSTAITIQTQTGSSLSEVLQNLSTVIRQRFRLKRKVEALSAEAKISAGIIGCLPLIVIGSMYLLNRDYIELLWTTNMGKMLTYGSVTWMSIGMLVMKGMINFKV